MVRIATHPDVSLCPRRCRFDTTPAAARGVFCEVIMNDRRTFPAQLAGRTRAAVLAHGPMFQGGEAVSKTAWPGSIPGAHAFHVSPARVHGRASQLCSSVRQSTGSSRGRRFKSCWSWCAVAGLVGWGCRLLAPEYGGPCLNPGSIPGHRTRREDKVQSGSLDAEKPAVPCPGFAGTQPTSQHIFCRATGATPWWIRRFANVSYVTVSIFELLGKRSPEQVSSPKRPAQV